MLIDDIDRLNKDEVRTVFQIIKACADFPNVRYLLLYDRDQVEFALRDFVEEPTAFLDKIVTQVFDLPLATWKQREKLIGESLDAIGFEELDGKPLERMQLLYDSVLLPGLPTVRHIKRFFGTVASLIPGVVVDSNRNVDPADFLALEFLRQNAPAVYRVVRDEEEPQPGGRVHRLAFHEKADKEHREALSAAVKLQRGENLQRLCLGCLETLEKDVQGSPGSRRSWSSIQHSERRFKSSHFRPVYLGFSAGRASIGQEPWQRFVDTLKSDSSLQWFFELLSDLTTRSQWVQIITDRTREIPLDKMKRLMVEVFQWAEARPRESEGFYSETMDWTSVVYLIGLACLNQLARNKSPVSVLTEAIAESGTTVAPAYLVGLEFDSLRKGEYSEWCKRGDLNSLADDLRKRLKTMLDDGTIWNLPDPYHAVVAWGHFIGDKEYNEWHDSVASNDDLLIKYLNRFLGSGYKLREEENWWVEPNDPLVEAMKNLDPERLSEAGKWARKVYLRSAVRQERRRSPGFEPEEIDLGE